jgi:type 1 glutamine amidotransferase
MKALTSNLFALLLLTTSTLAAAQLNAGNTNADYSQGSHSASAAHATRILIVVGPTDHPPGTHEVAAGGRLLKHSLENMSNLSGVKVDLFNEWPKDKAVRDAADTIVFIGDTFPPNRLPNAGQNLAELDEMMQRGCGIVCVHYATGLLGDDVKPDGDHPLLRWMGGYFANRSCPHHESFAKIFSEATIKPAVPQHPAWRGCREFTLNDEPYYNNYFGKNGNQPATNVTVLATSMLPPAAPKQETVSWCVERPDSGRGFAVVMPHFYRNWKLEDLRRYILNGIVWTAKLEVPSAGVQTTLPVLSAFAPVSLEPLPSAPKAKPASGNAASPSK